MNLDKVEDLIRQLLVEIGEDPNRVAHDPLILTHMRSNP